MGHNPKTSGVFSRLNNLKATEIFCLFSWVKRHSFVQLSIPAMADSKPINVYLETPPSPHPIAHPANFFSALCPA
jgi:hypothetical protein